MNINKVNDGLSISPQITPDEVSELAKLGFGSIICNRPDGESPNQPSFTDIRAQAKSLGLAAHYIPVVPGQDQAENAAEFTRALSSLPGPILAYCRSGARSAMLLSLGQPAAST